jgi:hypothetical protein
MQHRALKLKYTEQGNFMRFVQRTHKRVSAFCGTKSKLENFISKSDLVSEQFSSLDPSRTSLSVPLLSEAHA